MTPPKKSGLFQKTFLKYWFSFQNLVCFLKTGSFFKKLVRFLKNWFVFILKNWRFISKLKKNLQKQWTVKFFEIFFKKISFLSVSKN